MRWLKCLWETLSGGRERRAYERLLQGIEAWEEGLSPDERAAYRAELERLDRAIK